MKKFIKKILPEPLAKLYWLFKVARIKFITWIPKYNEDELITGHNADFMKDERFMSAYNSAVKAGLAISDKIHWRAHTICWAALRASQLEGDFVEVGVAKGFLSKVIVDYLNFKELSKNFFLLDTFEGFIEKYFTESEKKNGRKGGNYLNSASYEQVRETFRDYKNVKIIKGIVPDILSRVDFSKIAYLHIDMNCTIPEILAAEYFWDKMVSGAIMILDDYGHSGHEEQKYAFDEFAKRKNVSILSLPTGQGLIIKP
ncbi:MAG: TylF/MycF/NovP-related O-methyltransferase [Patescibacteria group bacterium]|nr:TylF/MycF/NovP-related O-methyltransferase [Patescibacteria group bacterium]